jgi:hypothetical protein
MAFYSYRDSNVVNESGAGSWNDLTDKPFYTDENGVVHPLDAKYLPTEEIQAMIDESLGVIENATY